MWHLNRFEQTKQQKKISNEQNNYSGNVLHDAMMFAKFNAQRHNVCQILGPRPSLEVLPETRGTQHSYDTRSKCVPGEYLRTRDPQNLLAAAPRNGETIDP